VQRWVRGDGADQGDWRVTPIPAACAFTKVRGEVRHAGIFQSTGSEDGSHDLLGVLLSFKAAMVFWLSA